MAALVALAMRWSVFKPLKKVGVENNKIKILEGRRVGFGLVWKLATGSCEVALKCGGIQEIWLVSKRLFLKPQELCPLCKITSRHSRGQFEQRAPDLTLKEAEEGIDS